MTAALALILFAAITVATILAERSSQGLGEPTDRGSPLSLLFRGSFVEVHRPVAGGPPAEGNR